MSMSNGTSTTLPLSPATRSGSNGPVRRRDPGATSLSKAAIVNIDEGGPPIACLFNPKEYTFSKSNTWSTGDTKGSNVPPMDFKSGSPASLQLQLFFDTYASGEDVRAKYTDPLWRLMQVNEKLKDKKNKTGRPPYVRFQWGKTWSFEGAIEKLTQKFTLFLPDGTPVRAVVDVTIKQMNDETLLPPQNPTSGGLDSIRLWTVQEGDTLAWIAYREYGDAGEWRRIADANQLSQVRRLRPGTVLEIPGA